MVISGFFVKKNDTVIFRAIFGVIFLVKTGLNISKKVEIPSGKKFHQQIPPTKY